MRFGSHLCRFLDSIDESHRNEQTQYLCALSAKRNWSVNDKHRILELLSALLLDEYFTETIASNFRHLLKDLLMRIERRNESKYEVFIALSKLVGYYKDVNEFVLTYFTSNYFSPFEPVKQAKKRKYDKKETVTQLRSLVAALNYLCFSPERFSFAWDWSPIFVYLDSDDNDLRFLTIQCLRIIFSMDDKQFFQLSSKYFDSETEAILRIKYSDLFVTRKLDLSVDVVEDLNEEKCLNPEDLSKDLIPICDIILSKVNNNLESNHHNFVVVPSFQEHLKSIALSLSFGEPVLIEGPVGCGKTSLVEYLAYCTNRVNPPLITKIQVGDQIDGKLLIGTHCCTDIPGEFVWKPGPLTESFLNGYWLLIEDIDCAPPDIVSILTSVIKTKSLSSVIGYPNSTCRGNENFRIFFTRRLMANNSEIHSSCESIYKLCNVVKMKSMEKEELAFVINELYPKLKPVTEKLIDIYYLIQDTSLNESNFKFITTASRTVTLRDLLKWCKRINEEFRINSDESTMNLFLNAADCFFQSLPSINDRLVLAEKLGSQLNIASYNSRSLITQRKPDIKIDEKYVNIGRIKLARKCLDAVTPDCAKPFFAYTHQSLNLLEKIGVCVHQNEPVLLVGETGTGKTSSIQYLAYLLHKKLTVVNMNQQSDTCDLLGGYKPVEFKLIVEPLRTEFESLFALTFDVKENSKFLIHISDCFHTSKWSNLFSLMGHVQKKALLKNFADPSFQERWKNLGTKIDRLQALGSSNPALGFSYVEGSLIKAMVAGEWILLDEINLAETETLQCLATILDSHSRSLSLFEKADGQPIERHPDFRLFACMNPATDVGKKELPLGIRNRFSEFYVEDLESECDLRILVQTYLDGMVPPSKVTNIVKLYLEARKSAEQCLTDANGARPHYSLRTLCRALKVCSTNPCQNIQRSLFEAFSLSFLTQLNRLSHSSMESLITSHLLEKSVSVKKSQIPKPDNSDETVVCEGYWISKGPKHTYKNPNYILTASVKKNIQDLSRIVSLGKSYPILLQGETSVGKTSLIRWLAESTGNVCVRVNNHEHTDLQEYVGTYCVDSNGKLCFKEGILVEAMRKGYWIILDELNLASIEVLEALNRVLDDNRELFIPEKQEVVKAHPKFILFATQNPPENYAGRKMLSRAFRNRFVELHFDEIPCTELEVILHEKCLLPLSYAKKMVGVLSDLRVRRRESGVFYGKHSFITLRDLFRWGERYRRKASECQEKFYDWDLYLANEGYILLAARVRKSDEANVVQEVLENRFKRKLDVNSYFDFLFTQFFSEIDILPSEFSHLVWTPNLKRLTVLMFEALKNKEPVLLIGDTGCGKTTVCQLYAALKLLPFFTVNCHMHTESADFLGSLRPVRVHDENDSRLFEWVDGPLIQAMQEGAVFLVDEISLADDSVLERLNSVLEPERSLLLSERALDSIVTSEDLALTITAKETFGFVATMNPGGDYGKKELSPALRNRFTEIWCQSEANLEDTEMIVSHNLSTWIDSKLEVSKVIADFFMWFLGLNGIVHISIRDVLSVTQFMNEVTNPCCINPLPSAVAVYHSICLVIIDSLGSGNVPLIDTERLKCECDSYLKSLIQTTFKIGEIDYKCNSRIDSDHYFGISPFYILRREQVEMKDSDYPNFVFNSPNAASNTLKLLRAMQISKPLLLEGAPGVGKTSLVQAVADATNHKIVRINLSEQTDISDLFGADLPVEGSEGVFSWRDGPLLQALKTSGTWIVLDELNLASQSVLEGLNACLDHRGEIYIPELGKTFTVDKTSTRIFACQNPYRQGGARKGLPQSFLNRFSIVFIESLTDDDLTFIISHTFPNLPKDLLVKMVSFNRKLSNYFDKEQSSEIQFEFNLRDLFRWCQIILKLGFHNSRIALEFSTNLIYTRRFRNESDRKAVKDIYEEVFDMKANDVTPDYNITHTYLRVGNAILKRNGLHYPSIDNRILYRQLSYIESVMKCLEMNWMAILTGASGVGKTTLVSLIAALSGQNLKVISMNPEMDATDLLGGFEQQDLMRHLTPIEICFWKHLKDFVTDSLLEADDYSISMKLFYQWYNYIKSSQVVVGDTKSILELIEHLETIFNEVKSMTSTTFNILQQDLSTLKSRALSSRVAGSGIFEWVDSVLVNAIKNGDWVLIDDANLCAASVLDRLNSLLEPGGSLVLSEKGVVDHELCVIRPHPNFRLILAMNPANGELSRAMRNRGIEIHILSQINRRDIEMQLRAIGFNDSDVLNNLIALHGEFIEDETSDIRSERSFLHHCSRILFEIHRNFSSTVARHLTFDHRIKFCVDDLQCTISDVSYASVLSDYYLFDVECDNYVKNSLQLDEINSCVEFTKMQLFLENISTSDAHIRKLMISKLCKEATRFLESKHFNDTIDSIIQVIGRKQYESLNLDEFPIELRLIDVLWNRVLLSLSEQDLHLLECSLNQWLLICFCFKLKSIRICEKNKMKQHSLLNMSETPTSFSTSFEFVKYLKKLIHVLETKVFDGFVQIKPTASELPKARCLLFWFHHLYLMCVTESNQSTFDEFLVTWMLLNEKYITKPNSLYNFSEEKVFKNLTKCLTLNSSEEEIFYRRISKHNTTVSLYNCVSGAELYSKLNEVCNVILSFCDQRKVKVEWLRILSEMYFEINNSNNHESVRELIEKITEDIKSVSASSSVNDNENEDNELMTEKQNRNNMICSQLTPLWNLCFCYVRVDDLLKNHNRSLDIAVNNSVLLHPFHEYLLRNTSLKLKNVLLLHYFLDFDRFSSKKNFNFWLTENDANSSVSSMTDDLGFTVECSSSVVKVSSQVLSNSCSLGLSQSRSFQLKKLKQFLWFNHSVLTSNESLNLVNLHKELVKEWYMFISEVCESVEFKSEFLPMAWKMLSEDNNFNSVGFAFCLIGFVSSHLFAPLTSVDPILRHTCKLNHYEMELRYINIELILRQALSYKKTGGLTALNRNVVDDLNIRKEAIERKIHKLSQKHRIRPKISQFHNLRNSVKHFLNTVLTEEAILNFTNCVNREDLTMPEANKLLRKSLQLQTSLANFYNQLLSTYPIYSDLLNNFIVGLHISLQGIKIMTHELKKRIMFDKWNKVEENELKHCLRTLGCFAHRDPFIQAQETLNATKWCISHVPEFNANFPKAITILFKSTFEELQNAATFHCCKKSVVKLMSSVVDAFFNCWKVEQEKKASEKEEEEALYKYKATTIEGELSEEEQTKLDIAMLFPSFLEEYEDLREVDVLSVKLETENTSKGLHLCKTSTDLLEVFQRHHQLLKILSNRVNGTNESNFIKSYRLRYGVLSNLLEASGYSLGPNLDSLFIEGIILMCNNELCVNTSAVSSTSSSFNIYRDCLPSELNQCSELLQSLESRIGELLIEFPGHPTLRNLIRIINRMLGFSFIDSSVMKFVTGFELFLEEANEWESKAHRGISLRSHLTEVTNMVIRWRTMELNNWKSCLESVHKKIEDEQLLKWWFHFYSMVTSLIREQSHENNCLKEFIASLKEFIESSKLGEFHIRLDLLERFKCYVHLLDSSSCCVLYNILHNVISFYQQFSPSVLEKITKDKKTIEKEVKDFVKIMRWNDHNFYALKNAVVKSHKTLHRFMKSYEGILLQPSSITFSANESKKKSESPWIMNVDENFVSKCEIKPTFTILDFGHLSKVEQYFKKSVKFTKRIVTSSRRLKQEVECINDLSSTVIETLIKFEKHELPNQITDKEKWRKAVRQLHHSKQQSLSTLWKELSKAGLSYRLGAQYFNDFDVDNILMECPLSGSDISKHCMNDLNSLNDYFFTSLSRLMALQKAMQNPSKQISRIQFDRIKGFSGHFISLITRNRNLLSNELKNLQTLKEYNQYFNLPDTEVVNQKKMSKWIDVLHKRFVELKSLLIQLKDLLSCFPENNDVLNLTVEFDCFLNDKRKCEIMEINIDKAQQRLNAFPIQILLEQKILTNTHFHQLKSLFDEIEVVSTTLNTVLEELHVASNDDPNSHVIVKQLSIVCSQILTDSVTFRNDFEGQEVNESEDDISSIFGCGEKLLLLVLSAIESLLKKLSLSNSEDKTDTQEVDNVIVNSSGITMIRSCLKSGIIVKCLKSLVSSVASVNCVKSLQTISKLIHCVQMFLSQFIYLYEYFLSLFVASQRTTCKLFYILLGMFIDLCTKGFCLPQELEDDSKNKMEGSKLKDISDAGFGEGDGTKDVSEKIESEDQLEDTFKDGKNLEEKGDNKEKIEDEEQGIEMSEDFDADLYSPKESEANDEDEDDENEDENEDEVDKKMGETDENFAETIDERLWGDDEEEDDNQKNDSGQGGGEDRSDPRVVAKDENQTDDKRENENTLDEDEKLDEITEEFEQPFENDEYKGEHEDPVKPSECEMINNEEVEQDMPEKMELDGLESDNDVEETSMDEEVPEKPLEEDVAIPSDEEMMEEEGDNEEANNISEAEMGTEDSNNPEDQLNSKDDEIDSEKQFTDVKSSDANAVESIEDKVENAAVNDNSENRETVGLAETESGGNDGDGETTYSKPSDVGSKNKPENANTERRSVAEHKRNDLQRKQIIDASETPTEDSNENNKKSELYQHINQDEKEDDQVIDIAHEEEENKYRPNRENEEAEEPSPHDQFNEQLEEENVTDKNKEKRAKDMSQSNKKSQQNEVVESRTTSKESDEVENLDKETVKSEIVARGPHSTIHTQEDMFVSEVENDDKSWFEALVKVSSECADMKEKEEKITQVWKEVEVKVNPLVRELCQQLQLVLEPTKTSKLKGDYKTGKRLNMRKVITYVASQFRKDKIWLRRTKPSKREYQIIVAVDDSLSMADNQSKQLAFESLALLAKSLTLIEAGELAVLSFGDETRLLHSFDEPFTSSAGAKLLFQLQFNQPRTRIADMLNKALSLMTKYRRNSNADLSQLLLIISDGRGLFNEGETVVRTAVNRMKSFGVFVVFVVIDDPNNKDSILDIRVPVFNESGKVTIETYMEKFPFPFYLILRDITSMPHVLGEALRQWFELVTASDR